MLTVCPFHIRLYGLQGRFFLFLTVKDIHISSCEYVNDLSRRGKRKNKKKGKNTLETLKKTPKFSQRHECLLDCIRAVRPLADSSAGDAVQTR